MNDDQREIYFNLNGKKPGKSRLETRSSSKIKKKNNSENFDQNFLQKIRTSTPSFNITKKVFKNNEHYISNEIQNFDLHKQMEEMSTLIKTQQKEIEKLKFLNKFYQIEKNQKELLISKLYDENTSLKAKIFEIERGLNIKKNNSNHNNNNIHNLLEPPTLLSKKILLGPVQLISENSNIKNTTNIGSNNFSARSVFEENFQNKLKPIIEKGEEFRLKSIFPKNMTRSTKNQDQNLNHQHILNMNLSTKAEMLLYEDNPFVANLTHIFQEQDIFIDFVSCSDISTLINFYDDIFGLFKEHKSLHFLIYRLKKLIKAANAINSALNLSESIEKIVDATVEFLECDRATVFIIDEKKEELWSKVAKGSDFTIRIPLQTGIVGHVVVSGKSVNIIDAYADDRFNQQIDQKTNYRTKTILCAPILDVSGRVTGAIQAINKMHVHFSKDDEGLLEILANMAGVILRNNLQNDKQLVLQNNLRNILKQGVHLYSIFSFHELVPKAEKLLKNTMNVDLAIIYIYDEKKSKIIHYNDQKEESVFDCYSGIAGNSIKTKGIQSIYNAYAHTLFNGKIDIDTTLPIICMPILSSDKERTLGVFEVLNPKGLPGASSKSTIKINSIDFETLQFFSLQMSQIIINVLEFENLKNEVANSKSHK